MKGFQGSYLYKVNVSKRFKKRSEIGTRRRGNQRTGLYTPHVSSCCGSVRRRSEPIKLLRNF